jgi:hypothetical protein
LLTIDDAFADGVCRCQFCGTIQTVPSKLKGASKSAAGAGKSAKSLYRNPAAKSAAAPTGTTLDNLAEIVSSSGLAGSGLSSMASRKKPVPAKAPESPKKMTPILIIGGAIILLLLAIVAILLLKGGAGTPGANPAPNPTAGASGATGGAETPGAGNPTGLESGSPGAGAPPPTAAQAGANPNFCGIPLTGQTIIYVLDNGSGSKDVFGDLLDATLRSAASLGPDRRFRIIFWDKSSSPSFPTTGFSPGDADSIESARSALANVVAYGATDPIAALTDALKLRPERRLGRRHRRQGPQRRRRNPHQNRDDRHRRIRRQRRPPHHRRQNRRRIQRTILRRSVRPPEVTFVVTREVTPEVTRDATREVTREVSGGGPVDHSLGICR